MMLTIESTYEAINDTWMRRRQSLRSECKVHMASTMASNIADDFID